MVEITRTHGSDTGATLPKRQRSLRRLQSGQSLLEVSLTLTILFLLFSGIVDLGRAFMTVVSLTNMISEGTQWAAAFPGCIAYARNATDAPQIPVNCRGSNSIIGRIINENTNLDLARVVNMSVTPVTAAPGDQVVITVTYQLPTITPIFQSMFGRNLTLTAQSIELVRGTDVPTYPGGHTDQPPNLSAISPVSYVSYQCDHGNAKLTWAAVAGVSVYDIFQGPVTTHASASYSFSTTADPVVFPTTGVPGAGASAVLNITTFNDDGAGHFTL